jgi:Putative beta-lactamase-like family
MLIKRVSVKESNGYLVRHENKRILFDVPSWVQDKFTVPFPGEPSGYIKVAVPRDLPGKLDGIFISRGDFIGVFFAKIDAPVYITLPVYQQMCQKVKKLIEMGAVCTEAEESEKHVVYSVCEAREINSRLRILAINQAVSLAFCSIKVSSAGTHLGWSNYSLVVGNQVVLFYSAGVSGGASLAREFDRPLPAQYAIVDRTENEDDLDRVTGFVKRGMDRGIAIVTDMFMGATEIALHLLSIAQDLSVYVSCKKFFWLTEMYNTNSSFLSKSLRKKCYDGKCPLSLHTEERVKLLSPLEIGSTLAVEGKKVFLIDQTDYELHFRKSPLPIPVVRIGEPGQRIKFFASESEVRSLLENSEVLFSAKNVLQDGRTYRLSLGKNLLYNLKIENTDMVEEVQRGSGVVGRVKLCFRGRVMEQEETVSLVCEKIPLKDMFLSKPRPVFVFGETICVERPDGALVRVAFEGGNGNK